MFHQTLSGYRDEIYEVLDQILEVSRQREVRYRLDSRRERLEEKAPSALQTREDGFHDATTVLALPEKSRKRLRKTHMLKPVIQEICRWEKPVRIFTSKGLAYLFVEAPWAEPHEEWSTGRPYLNMGEYFEWRADRLAEDSSDEEASPLEDAYRAAAVPA